jgi:hypothetical protein
MMMMSELLASSKEMNGRFAKNVIRHMEVPTFATSIQQMSANA